jgi:hypothetical protein
VWVTGSLAKVHPDATPGTQQSVQISSARNEFESFQIHVRAASNPIALSVTVSNFVNAQTGDVIASNGNVFVHREAYLDITTLSDANGTHGLTPDPLIPVKDAYLNEPRNAFPETVPLNEVRSAWVDVLVPDTARSGYYTATVTVSDGASVLAAVPAVLKVWNFTLPSTASLKSAFGMAFDAFCVHVFDGTYNGCDQYPGSGGSADHGIELSHLAIARFFLDHRITISGLPYPPPPTRPMGRVRRHLRPVVERQRRDAAVRREADHAAILARGLLGRSEHRAGLGLAFLGRRLAAAAVPLHLR